MSVSSSKTQYYGSEAGSASLHVTGAGTNDYSASHAPYHAAQAGLPEGHPDRYMSSYDAYGHAIPSKARDELRTHLSATATEAQSWRPKGPPVETALAGSQYTPIDLGATDGNAQGPEFSNPFWRNEDGFASQYRSSFAEGDSRGPDQRSHYESTLSAHLHMRTPTLAKRARASSPPPSRGSIRASFDAGSAPLLPPPGSSHGRPPAVRTALALSRRTTDLCSRLSRLSRQVQVDPAPLPQWVAAALARCLRNDCPVSISNSSPRPQSSIEPTRSKAVAIIDPTPVRPAPMQQVLHRVSSLSFHLRRCGQHGPPLASVATHDLLLHQSWRTVPVRLGHLG